MSGLNFYSLGNDTTSTLFSSMFGSGTSSSGTSLLSSVNDLNMIRSGAYKKAISAYYAQVSTDSDSNTIGKSGTEDSNVRLSTLKSAAKSTYNAAKELKNADYSSSAKAEDLLDETKNFISSYNSMINSTKNMNSYSILQTAVWGTEQMNLSEGLLNKVGISIDEKNNLTLDEETFKNAKMSDLKALFSGSGSLADRVGQKASTLFNQSTNQLAVNQGKNLYTMNGTLI